MNPREKLLKDLKIGCGKPRPVKAPRGSQLHCRGWYQEAALRMLCNNLDPDNGENPDELIVYGDWAKPPETGSVSMPSSGPCWTWKTMKPCWYSPASLWGF